jgi:DNA-binding MarR family transcriptional regulator
MSDNALKLENQLCFRIYSASRLMTRLYKPILDNLNLTYPQYVTMLVVWEKEIIDFRELKTTLNMSTGTLTPIIKRLVKLDYLSKIKNPNDDRKAIVKLTKAGLELKDKALQIPENLAKSLDMSFEEYLEFTNMLDNLTEKLNNAQK